MASYKITKLVGAKPIHNFKLKERIYALSVLLVPKRSNLAVVKKVIVIFVPVPQLQAYQKIQQRSRYINSSVHDAILDNMIYSTELVVYLDNNKDTTSFMEYKLQTFSTVYKKLTIF
ncbi:hypothetical protein INT45_004324 [Circinella minor]|uniref:Uncharacterized protein n=1 Tax=Circinella minor TaxID=1195481 RepID=A0A8H7SBQ6_9FUNG|nr:hypothetical protein INT45_004324 [Circinella minor]